MNNRKIEVGQVRQGEWVDWSGKVISMYHIKSCTGLVEDINEYSYEVVYLDSKYKGLTDEFLESEINFDIVVM